jgi:hypothetical protein
MQGSLTDALSEELRSLTYPVQLRYVDRGIDGQGFYPGARECIFGDPSSPLVMLVGRDFGTWDYYSGLASQRGRSEYALTWRHTRDIYLRELAGLRLFCTNYLMGVRVDGSAKGDVSSRMSADEWSGFEQSCWGFLERQLAEASPSLILVFGADNRRDLDRPTRLGGIPADVLYGPHPHSAIGERNRFPHMKVCGEIRRRLSP